MRKKISMLIVAVGVLAGGVLFAPKEASAYIDLCPPYCWDPACTCVFHGWWMGGSCVYEDWCTVDLVE